MARKRTNRQLGALAALGALGYSMFGPDARRRKDGSLAPVEYRGTDRAPETGRAPVEDRVPPASAAAPVAAAAPAASFADGDADIGMGINEYGDVYYPYGAVPAAAARPPAGAAARPPAGAGAAARPPAGAGAGAGAGVAAAARAMGMGDPGYTQADMDAYRARTAKAARVDPTTLEGYGVNEVGRGMAPAARRAPINDRENVFDPRAAGPLTREEAIASIPGQSARAPQDGVRVSGNNFTRNVGNILNAPVPGVMPFGRMIGRGATTGRAATTGREVGFLNETPVTYLGTSSRATRSGPTAAIEGGSAARAALNAPQSQLNAPARRLGAPTQRLGGPSATSLKEAERAARAERLREQVLKENAAAYGLNPNAPGYEAAMRALRKNLGGDDFTLKKKGGAVKAKKMASGGMSSASKRGDGIATKGKTKCKMY